MPGSVLAVLKREKRGRIAGGLYHRLQIDFIYNTNHMEGSHLTHGQTRWIFETQTVGKLPSDMPIERARLLDTCRTGQDMFILELRRFGHDKLADKAEAQMAADTDCSAGIW